MWYGSNHRRRFCWFGLLISMAILLASSAGAANLQISGSAVGAGRFPAHTWGLMTLTVDNAEAQARQFFGVVATDQQSATQFVADLWLPPRSRLVCSVPFYIAEIERNTRSIPVTVLLTPQDQPNLALSRQPALLIADHSSTRMGLVHDSANEVVIDLSQAVRKSAGQDDRLVFMRTNALPGQAMAYQALHQMLLAHSQLRLDGAQVAALRQWLVQGGRLWIMADLVPGELLDALLMEDESLAQVSRVELHELTIEGEGAKTQISSERPIALVRVLPSEGWQVMQRVEGWPASLRRQVGQGVIVVTTLGARAWVDDGKKLRASAEPVTRVVMQKQATSTSDLVRWDRFLLEQIGYRVISRTVVLSVLAGFLVTYLLTGLCLHRQGRMEHMGWIGAILAVVGGAVLLGLGVMHRQDTPSTVVSGSMVEVVPAQRLMLADGQMQIYARQQDDSARIEASRGGEFLPTVIDRTGREMIGAGRMIWTDMDRWQWERLSLPENAVASARFANGIMMSEPAGATLRFGAQGLAVEATGDWVGAMEDVIIVGPTGKLAAKSTGGGQWSAGPAEVLGSGQYIKGVMSGQQQVLRQNIYRTLFEPPATGEAMMQETRMGRGSSGMVSLWKAQKPMLLGWSNAVPMGLSTTLEARRVGWSLVRMPLEIERPAEGARILVPDAMVKFEVSRGEAQAAGDGKQRTARVGRLTTAYDENRGQWLAINQGGTVPVKFSLPVELLPVKWEEARLWIDIRAAGRTVELKLAQGEQSATLIKRDSPLGRYEVVISAEQLSQVETQGSITCLLTVSELSDAGAMGQPWNVQGIGLEVTATVGAK